MHKYIKLLKEIDINLYDTGLSNVFLYRTPKA